MSQLTPLFERLGEFLISIDGGNVSRHLDEITTLSDDLDHNYEFYVSTFRDLVRFLRVKGERRTVIWVFPLPASEALVVSKPDAADISSDVRASSIYLVAGTDVFIQAAEEYRCALSFSELYDEGHAVFRSWRDSHGTELGWEFNNDFYFWSYGAEQVPGPIN